MQRPGLSHSPIGKDTVSLGLGFSLFRKGIGLDGEDDSSYRLLSIYYILLKMLSHLIHIVILCSRYCLL